VTVPAEHAKNKIKNALHMSLHNAEYFCTVKIEPALISRLPHLFSHGAQLGILSFSKGVFFFKVHSDNHINKLHRSRQLHKQSQPHQYTTVRQINTSWSGKRWPGLESKN
jgi:hypothetical protein